MLQISSIQYRKMDFEEFCSAAISVHQLEGMESWEQHARRAYELFEKDGNRPIMIEELASVCFLSLSYLYFQYVQNNVCRVAIWSPPPILISPFYLAQIDFWGWDFYFILIMTVSKSMKKKIYLFSFIQKSLAFTVGQLYFVLDLIT